MMKHRLTAFVALGFACLSTHAAAQPADVTAGVEPAYFELGLFGGLFFPSKSHELLSRGPFLHYDSPAPELGARLAVLPLPFLGFELEGSAMTTDASSGDPAGLWAGRVHAVAQAPLGRVVPLLVLGGGALGAGSNAMGSDTDPALHFGVGMKVVLDEFLAIRVDFRDTLAQKRAAEQGAQTHFPEVLLGLAFSLRKAVTPKPVEPESPKDRDGDGVLDEADGCPDEPGALPSGCPIRDTDGDRLSDDKDACPQQAGRAPCGCPPVDGDGDKVIDELDGCPTQPGPIEGCPDPDADRDGVPVPGDVCPDKPETVNDFEDRDGCPDEVPERVKRFTGVIQGIEFDRAKETIRPVSAPTLDSAAKVLEEYPSLRVLITGHTDTDGNRLTNLDLSKRRAESVKSYFVGKGIDASRIETRGEGPDQAIADNKTAAGKQKNRRIEFKLINEAKAPEKGQP